MAGEATLDYSQTPVATPDETIAFILDTRNYREFDLTRPDFCGIYDCLDPRNIVRGLIAGIKSRRIKTVYQTAGGGAGIVDDRATYEAVQRGKVVSVEEAEELEKNARGATALDGHPRCRFIEAIEQVKQEEAAPSAETLLSFEQTLWIHRRPEFRKMEMWLPRLSEAAQAQLNNFDAYGMDERILDRLNKHYPHHDNVKDVNGDNQASVYLINHSQRVGLDRNKKAERLVVDNLDIQFYHDSRGAAFADLLRVHGTGAEILSPEQLNLYLAAFTLRSCAVETVLCNMHPTQVWELTHSTGGLSFAPVKETFGDRETAHD